MFDGPTVENIYTFMSHVAESPFDNPFFAFVCGFLGPVTADQHS